MQKMDCDDVFTTQYEISFSSFFKRFLFLFVLSVLLFPPGRVHNADIFRAVICFIYPDEMIREFVHDVPQRDDDELAILCFFLCGNGHFKQNPRSYFIYIDNKYQKTQSNKESRICYGSNK